MAQDDKVQGSAPAEKPKAAKVTNVARKGYSFVTVPPNYNIVVTDVNGNRKKAEEGDVVELSNKSLDADQHLKQFVIGASAESKKDFYSRATTESLKAALRKRDVPDPGNNRQELIATSREQGVPMEDLEIFSEEDQVKK